MIIVNLAPVLYRRSKYYGSFGQRLQKKVEKKLFGKFGPQVITWFSIGGS